MKLLLVTLLTGATAHSVKHRTLWQLRNMMECTIQGSHPLKDYNTYSCFCGSNTPVDELDRCCKTQDHCYDQVKKLEICAFPHSPYTTPYSDSCSGNEVTCNDENDACEAFICNCDLQAAICFSKASYTKKKKGIHC